MNNSEIPLCTHSEIFSKNLLPAGCKPEFILLSTDCSPAFFLTFVTYCSLYNPSLPQMCWPHLLSLITCSLPPFLYPSDSRLGSFLTSLGEFFLTSSLLTLLLRVIYLDFNIEACLQYLTKTPSSRLQR